MIIRAQVAVICSVEIIISNLICLYIVYYLGKFFYLGKKVFS